MLLDRLIARARPSEIQYGTVAQVNETNGRALIVGKNGLQFWAGYLPADFPSLSAGSPVAVAAGSGGGVFLVRELSLRQPQTTLLEL